MNILSLFDYSGSWSKPYRDAGYNVTQVDIKLGQDIFDFNYNSLKNVHGILVAPPCTDFSLSGSRYFAKKDIDGTTAKSVALVYKALEIIDHYNPKWWALENPMSRIMKLVPELGPIQYKFNPYDHGDPYQKMTWLWGNFTLPTKHPVPNTLGNSLTYSVGGKSEKTKEKRSITPLGFAQDFFKANP